MDILEPNIAFSTHIGLPIFLAGFLLLGSGISFYLYQKLEEDIYISLAFFQFCSFLYAFLESLVMYFTMEQEIATSLQFSRLEELTIGLFLIAIPWLMRNISKTRFTKITKILIKIGIVANIIFIITAFLMPEWFVSVTRSVSEGSLLKKHIGRADQGVLYYVRDVLMATFLIYSLIFLSDLQKEKSFLNFTKWIYTGAILTIIFSVIDLLNPYVHFKGEIFPVVLNLPYSVVGLSIFGFFIITGEFRMFMKRIRKKQEYLRVLVDNRTQKLNEEIRQKDEIEKKLEEEKEKAIELAEKAKKANEEKSQFMTNISHEMRTPMNGILGMAQILMEEDLDEDQQKNVEIIYNSGRSLMHLVENILDFSDISPEKNIAQKSSVNLKELIESIRNTLSPKIKKNKIDFSSEYNAPEYIIANENRLYQVIMNLVDNAVKFTNQGKVKIKVSVNKQLSEYKAEFSIVVEDTGIGISGETLNEVLNESKNYEEFIPGQDQNESYGLLIVKKLVEIMKGYIELDSQPGQGSKFTVNLPLQIDKDQSETVKYKPNKFELDVLVVEDSEEDNIILQKLLKRKGCNVQSVYNGMEAIDKLEKQEFHIILLDLIMPKLDGFETAEVIRNGINNKIGESTFLIGLTSRKLGIDKERLYDVGINDYIRKPIDITDIESILNQYIKWKKK